MFDQSSRGGFVIVMQSRLNRRIRKQGKASLSLWHAGCRLKIYIRIKQHFLVAAEMAFLVRFLKYGLSLCSCRIVLLASHLSVL